MLKSGSFIDPVGGLTIHELSAILDQQSGLPRGRKVAPEMVLPAGF
jgi:hypothetical protein